MAVVLFELVAVGSASQLELVQRYRTREASVLIDLYGFIVVPIYGAPDASDGDFAHRTLPSGTSIVPTATFLAN